MKARLAWSVAVVGMFLSAVSFVAGLARPSLPGIPDFTFSEVVWIASFAFFLPVGALLAARLPQHPVGWLLLSAGASMALAGGSHEYATWALLVHPGSLPFGEVASWVSAWSWSPAIPLVALILLLFPTGRYLSRRWSAIGWVVIAAAAVVTVTSAFTWPLRGPRLLGDLQDEASGLATIIGIGFSVIMAMVVAAAVSLIVRFRRAVGEERQQLKLLTFAAGVAIVGIVLTEWVLTLVGLDDGILESVVSTISGPGMVPVVVGIAITRYRLYDLDVVINRTLVYGSLTAILAGAYLLIVVSLQQILSGVTQDSDFAVAGSTLAVAALFQPLRAKVQSFIDRRFYRSRYDAARTLETFSTRVRDEVDLAALQSDLLTVVHDTLTPRHASLWLRAPSTGGPR